MTRIHSYLEALMLADEKPQSFAAGQVLFEEGAHGREMFIVRAGSVELRHAGRLLETVTAGGMVGEMALLDSSPRSATAVAGADCTVAVVDEATFHELVQRVPGLALELLRILVKRLRRTTTANKRAAKSARRPARKPAAPARTAARATGKRPARPASRRKR
jgi:CRP/FNR family transcriptional regulator, cyclic AMP receptor protein